MARLALHFMVLCASAIATIAVAGNEAALPFRRRMDATVTPVSTTTTTAAGGSGEPTASSTSSRSGGKKTTTTTTTVVTVEEPDDRSSSSSSSTGTGARNAANTGKASTTTTTSTAAAKKTFIPKAVLPVTTTEHKKMPVKPNPRSPIPVQQTEKEPVTPLSLTQQKMLNARAAAIEATAAKGKNTVTTEKSPLIHKMPPSPVELERKAAIHTAPDTIAQHSNKRHVAPKAAIAAKNKKWIRQKGASDCMWDTRSVNGASFDLRNLRRMDNELSYHITNGDGETDVHEHTGDYSFAWNICADVSPVSEPFDGICKESQHGPVIEYMNRTADVHHEAYKECHSIGEYIPDQSEHRWALLNPDDPTVGVSLVYPNNSWDTETCSDGSSRTATIEVFCSENEFEVMSMNEASECQYRFIMSSMYACPAQCEITDIGGLCSGAGECEYDSDNQVPFCECDYGYHGSACELGWRHNFPVLTVVFWCIVCFSLYKFNRYRQDKAKADLNGWHIDKPHMMQDDRVDVSFDADAVGHLEVSPLMYGTHEQEQTDEDLHARFG